MNKKSFLFIAILMIVLTGFLNAKNYKFNNYIISDGGEDGTWIILKYNGTDISVVIPSKINNIEVSAIGEKAFYGNAAIETVHIPASVKSIGDEAFAECTNLYAVNGDLTVISLGSSVFKNTEYGNSKKSKQYITIAIFVFLFGFMLYLLCKLLRNKLSLMRAEEEKKLKKIESDNRYYEHHIKRLQELKEQEKKDLLNRIRNLPNIEKAVNEADNYENYVLSYDNIISEINDIKEYGNKLYDNFQLDYKLNENLEIKLPEISWHLLYDARQKTDINTNLYKEYEGYIFKKLTENIIPNTFDDWNFQKIERQKNECSEIIRKLSDIEKSINNATDYDEYIVSHKEYISEIKNLKNFKDELQKNFRSDYVLNENLRIKLSKKSWQLLHDLRPKIDISPDLYTAYEEYVYKQEKEKIIPDTFNNWSQNEYSNRIRKLPVLEESVINSTNYDEYVSFYNELVSEIDKVTKLSYELHKDFQSDYTEKEKYKKILTEDAWQKLHEAKHKTYNSSDFDGFIKSEKNNTLTLSYDEMERIGNGDIDVEYERYVYEQLYKNLPILSYYEWSRKKIENQKLHELSEKTLLDFYKKIYEADRYEDYLLCHKKFFAEYNNPDYYNLYEDKEYQKKCLSKETWELFFYANKHEIDDNYIHNYKKYLYIMEDKKKIPEDFNNWKVKLLEEKKLNATNQEMERLRIENQDLIKQLSEIKNQLNNVQQEMKRPRKKCTVCGGTGSIVVSIGSYGEERESCWACHGAGELNF